MIHLRIDEMDSREAFEAGRDEYYRGEGNGAFDGFVAWDAAWQHQQARIDALESQLATLTAERDILKPDALCDSGCVYQCTEAYTVKAKCLCSK